MNQEELQKLVLLREKAREFYGSLDGKTNPGTAIIKQADVAYMLETIINSLDDFMSPHVSFSAD
jgi:hypothetical protein|tara:strand:- start:171 stop:362 length:192 start_codon:yes stop_codon:yes gene_type:complete